MARTIVLFGRCTGVTPVGDEAAMCVPWKDAHNFQDNAANMITGEYENAVVFPINSTHGAGQAAAVRISVDHTETNFRGFKAEFWLNDKPYAPAFQGGSVEPFDFDWVAYIPCAATLT